ncbi:MAG: hypothetical protein BGO69_17090 [Bacteroidetes bacterium 46-16]|nr:MAG: hypothetical protein BGO69_17090 [Bacteroidetes bacterium 46-16]
MVTEYLDGLLRPIQYVKRRLIISEQDIVKPMYYDSFNREKIEPEVYINSSDSLNNGSFKRNAFANQVSYFTSQYPNEYAFYDKTQYDDTSLYRSVKKMASGASKSGSDIGRIRSTKLNSSSDNIRKWQFNGFTSVPTTTQSWGDNTLYITEFTNEYGKRGRKYVDREGKLILGKIEISTSSAADNTHNGWQCTYYVYDEYSRLRQVITPKAVDSIANNGWSISSTIMSNLCYSYNYDNKNRVISKKLPGQSAINILYDRSDRQVMVQDGNLTANHQWLFTKYDGLGREILTGKFINTGNLSSTTLQAQLDGTATNSFVQFLKTKINENTYDTSSSIPDAQIFQINYYDTYNSTPISYSSYNDDAVQNLINGNNSITEKQSAETRVKPTGSCVRVMDGNNVTNQWLKSVFYYDTYGNLIQTQSTNYNNGLDTASMRYNFNGQIISSLFSQSNPATTNITHVPNVKTYKTYHYNDWGNLSSIQQKINDESYWRTITSRQYDKFGRIKIKNLGGLAESQNYTYRIWGALESINKDYCQSGTGNHFFGEVINYDFGFTSNSNTEAPSGMTWRLKGSPTIQRAYGYQYDACGRLLSADYRQSDNNASYSNTVEDYTAKNITYDGNGNLLTMDQWATSIAFGGPVKIDQLKYRYLNNGLSNQLQAVDDSITQAYDLGEFKEAVGTTATDYTYDVNGNLTRDTNKSLYLIQYDHNDKPYYIQFDNYRSIRFTYSASGDLLKKTIINTTQSPSTTTFTYFGGLVYKNDSLITIGHEEGRCRPVPVLDTSHNPHVTYEYDYFVKDHLGNVRSVLTEELDSNNNYLYYDAVTRQVSITPIYYDPRAVVLPAAYTRFTIGNRNYVVTNELNNSLQEEATFENIPDTRSDKINTLDTNDLKETLLNGEEGKIIGPSMMLRVMAGDSLSVNTATYYDSPDWDSSTVTVPVEDVVSSLLTALSGGGPYSTLNITGFEGGGGSSTINIGGNSSTILQNALESIQTANEADSIYPQAFLNYIFLDDNMQVVPELSGRLQTDAADNWSNLNVAAFPVTKNGYFITFLSNESHINVHFDNLLVKHYKGKLLEENHYYPYGLSIKRAAILQAPDNNTLFSSKDLNHKEFSDGSGLDWYDFDARQFDPQIGRWLKPDPLSEYAHNWSPYRYAFDNPNLFSDNTGLIENDGPGDDGYWDHDGHVNGPIPEDWDNSAPNHYATHDADRNVSDHYTAHEEDREEDHEGTEPSGPGEDEHGIAENYLIADVYEPFYLRPLHPRGNQFLSNSTAYFPGAVIPAASVQGMIWETIQGAAADFAFEVVPGIAGTVGATVFGIFLPSNFNQPHHHDEVPFHWISPITFDPKALPWVPGVSPGPAWKWRGNGTPESGNGNWVHPDGTKLDPDIDHELPKGPHWGVTNPDGTTGDVTPDGVYHPTGWSDGKKIPQWWPKK